MGSSAGIDRDTTAAAPPPAVIASRRFKIVLIKPSHYDADGYVIQWWRSTIPSNSLASVYGLLRECAEEHTLGPDVEIDIEAYDECNTVIDIKRIVRDIRKAGGGFVGAGRRAVEPVSARARSGAHLPQAGCAGRDRRLPCQRRDLDAAEADAGIAGGARSRRRALCRRGRRPDGGFPARHGVRTGQAASTIT